MAPPAATTADGSARAIPTSHGSVNPPARAVEPARPAPSATTVTRAPGAARGLEAIMLQGDDQD
jgi:hypothetical protein